MLGALLRSTRDSGRQVYLPRFRLLGVATVGWFAFYYAAIELASYLVTYLQDFDLPCAVIGYAWAFLWAVLKIAQYEVG